MTCGCQGSPNSPTSGAFTACGTSREGWGLKVGKDYTPITFFLSGQVFDADDGLLQVGNAYGARQGQVAVEGNLGPGIFKFAAINPSRTGRLLAIATWHSNSGQFGKRELFSKVRGLLPDEVCRQHERACVRRL